MNVLIVGNRLYPKSMDAVAMSVAYLSALGVEARLLDASELPPAWCVHDAGVRARVLERVGEACDLIIVLGGDGTILRAARIAALYEAPILGINCGHMGFLANDGDGGVVSLIAAALADEVRRDSRCNLEFEVVCQGDPDSSCPDPKMATGAPRKFFAVNEAVIGRGESGRLVQGDIYISGTKVQHVRGDGVIVATATGSTAYALSAGGPLLSPGHRGLEVVPLAPHTLLSRAIVTEPHDVVEVNTILSDEVQDLVVYADGDTITFPAPIERVIVRPGFAKTVLLDCGNADFYQKIANEFFG